MEGSVRAALSGTTPGRPAPCSAWRVPSRERVPGSLSVSTGVKPDQLSSAVDSYRGDGGPERFPVANTLIVTSHRPRTDRASTLGRASFVRRSRSARLPGPMAIRPLTEATMARVVRAVLAGPLCLKLALFLRPPGLGRRGSPAMSSSLSSSPNAGIVGRRLLPVAAPGRRGRSRRARSRRGATLSLGVVARRDRVDRSARRPAVAAGARRVVDLLPSRGRLGIVTGAA